MVSETAKGVIIAAVVGIGALILTGQASGLRTPSSLQRANEAVVGVEEQLQQAIRPVRQGGFFQTAIGQDAGGGAVAVTQDAMGNIVRTARVGGDPARGTGTLEERGPAGVTDPGLPNVNNFRETIGDLTQRQRINVASAGADVSERFDGGFTSGVGPESRGTLTDPSSGTIYDVA